MNSDNLSLVMMLTGSRGSGKTMIQTGDMCRRLERAYLRRLLGMPCERIYSNYPAGFMFYPGNGLPPAYLKPEPLNMESLYVFDKGLTACRLYIDEIDQWLDRQEWMTTTQQILSKAVQLIRKRKMSITGTIQSFNWLNSKFQFQTDIVVKCRDAAFTPWGRERSLSMGEVIFTSWMDKSGVMTGYSYDDKPKLYQLTWQTKRLWNCYDTTYEFDPMETSTRYTLKRPQKEIVMPGADSDSSGWDGAPQTPYIRDRKLHSEKKNRIDVIVAQVVDDVQGDGKFIITKEDFYNKVDELAGASIDHKEAGYAMSRLGYKSYGSGGMKYNLTPSEEASGVDLGSRNKEEVDAATDSLFSETNHPAFKQPAGVKG